MAKLRTFVVVTASLCLCLSMTACNRTDIATIAAKRQPFVHRVHAEGNLVAVSSTPITVPVQVRGRARVAWMAEDGSRVAEGAVVLRFDDRDMERNLENAKGDLNKTSYESIKTVAESDNQLTELTQKSELANLQLEVSTKFQYEDDEVFSRNEIIESRIDGELAKTRKEHASDVGSIRKDLRDSETALVDISRRLALQKISEAQDGLEALEVRAPHSGLLTWARDWTGEPIKVGAEVWQGRELGSLPSLNKMDAQVYVLEADAGGIEAGQSAVLTIEARPEIAVPATVSSIDAVSQPRFRGSPVRYFGVTLAPETTHTEFMKPGQRVTALIYIEDRPEALVVPRQALHRSEGLSYVYKKSGDGFERTQVEVGPQSIALAVIEGGLDPGDLVALEDPMAATEEPTKPLVQPEASQTAPTGAP